MVILADVVLSDNQVSLRTSSSVRWKSDVRRTSTCSGTTASFSTGLRRNWMLVGPAFRGGEGVLGVTVVAGVGDSVDVGSALGCSR